MTSTPRLRLLEGTVALAIAAASFVAGPALAQKQGGTLTVGLELDIPGFDPLKVGVYDTAANIAASLILETLVKLDDNGKATPSLAAVVDQFRRLQDLDLQAPARREVP